MSDSLVLSVVGLSIGAFLDICDLAMCEKAKIFSPYVFEWLWELAGAKLLVETPLWNITVDHFYENGLRGKSLISQIQSLKRGVALSNWLKPSVVKTSFCSVKATPILSTSDPVDFYDDESDNNFALYSAKQSRTGVAVTVGTNIGQPMVIGMKFAATGPVDDNFCVGIEAVGFAGGDHMMSVSFAPFSGICFIEHENGVTIKTKALPFVRDVREGYVWIHVTEKGGIRFLRHFKNGKVEDSGVLSPQILPGWIQSYFGCVDFWLSNLGAVVDVSVEYSGCAFPTDMSIYSKAQIELETTWSLLGEINW